MKKYLLLRNNKESGPYSIEQLGSMNLLALDLVWIEEDSTCWKYPDEIEELKSLINYNAEIISDRNDSLKKKGKSISTGFDAIDESAPEINFAKPVKCFEENYRTSSEKQAVWKKRFLLSTEISSIAAVVIGVMIGAFVIKKWVDELVPGTTAESIATPVFDREPTPVANEDFQNALVTEIVPVYKKTNHAAKHVNIKKQVKLKASDYKVGLFGGINGLQLTVFNTSSSEIVDKALVAVNYLKRGGDVVQSENAVFTFIKPGNAQTISIPGSNRGVKVQYKILKVYSHNYKADLKHV